MLSRDTDDGVDLYLIKWVVRVIAVTCIFQVSYGHKFDHLFLDEVYYLRLFKALGSSFSEFY